MTVDHEQVREILQRCNGSVIKFATAYCKARGWRRGTNGRPVEWYQAFCGELGDVLARILSEH